MSGSNSSPAGAGDAVRDAATGVSSTVPTPPVPAVTPDARRTRRGRWQMFGLLAVCVAPVLASYFAYYVIRPEGRTNYGDLVTPPSAMPDSMPLHTLEGAAVAPRSLHGQWLLVVVADAACDAVCETNLYLQRQLREALGREMERVDKVWLITDDATPRPEVLDAVGAGTPVNVLRVAQDELAQWLAPARGHDLGEHLYVVDPMGRWMMRQPARPDPARTKRDLERLLRASASWDNAGRPDVP